MWTNNFFLCVPQLLSILVTLSVSSFISSGVGRGGRDSSPTTTTVLRHHRHKELIFAEEFYDLDPSVWYHEIYPPGLKNGEFQSYSDSRENSYVKNGILYIQPTLRLDKYSSSNSNSRRNRSINVDNTKSYTNMHHWENSKKEDEGVFNPIVSARLNSRRAFAFQYGQIEVRAKLPEGDWIWPAIWLLPQQARYGEWPKSGEIDLMESRGNLELVNGAGESIGVTQFGSTLHFGINRTTDLWRLAHFERNDSKGLNSRFHNYGMLWTPKEITFTFDDEVIGRVVPASGGFWDMGNFTGPSIWSDDRMSPFDQPFNLVLNVAVGGTFGYFPDNTGPYKKPWNNTSPTAMMDFWDARESWMQTWKGEDSALQVDHVRIWAL